MQNIVDTIVRNSALESRSYVVSAVQVANDASPAGLKGYRQKLPFIGGSGIVSPWGQYIQGPVFHEEGLVIADLNLEDLVQARSSFFNMGKEKRDDLFHYQLKRS